MIKSIFKNAILIIIILSTVIANYSFAMGPAITVGTVENTAYDEEKKEDATITTTSLIEYAANCYEKCGYTNVKRLKDPSYILLLSNALASEVQLYSTHGSIDSITYTSKTGICITTKNSGGAEYIGVDALRNGWKSNCKFVMYMACNTGGKDGNASTDSLVFHTVSDAAPACIGLTKTVSYSRGLEPWSKNFNERLSNGYGVYDSLIYANQFDYSDSKVKYWHMSYNGDITTPNLKIGKYAGQEINSIDTSIGKERKNILKNDIYNLYSEEQIINEIKKYDNNFDSKNYIMQESKSVITETNNKGEVVSTINLRNISYTLKIGDFITNAAYVVSIIDDKLIGIYDNNIDIDKQSELLKKTDSYKIDLSTEKINNYMKDSEKNVNAKYNLKNANSVEDNIKYFYDIKTDKKYIEIDVESEINGDIAIDTIEYEIN